MKDFSVISKPQIELPDIIYSIWCFLTTGYKGDAAIKLEDSFKDLLQVDDVFSFNAARSALFILFKALDVNGEEVLIQGYTHIAVPNSIIWAGGVPVFVDIDPKTYNMDVKDLRNKVTPKSKIIVVQHSFGLPANLDEILQIARENNLLVIEDCAHSLGAKYNGKFVGTFGDASIFSFGATKVIDAASGGILVVNNKQLASQIKKIYASLSLPPVSWTRGQLIFLISKYFLKPKYPGIYSWLRSVKFIPLMVTAQERQGKQPTVYPALMPNSLAKLILRQMPKLDRLNSCREQAANLYRELLSGSAVKLPAKFPGRVYLKFSVQTPKANKIIKKAAGIHLDLSRIFGNVIGPADANLQAVGYFPGSCPVAEKVAKNSADLPVGILIDKKWAREIALFVKSNTR